MADGTRQLLFSSVTGRTPRARNFCRVLLSGHCRCWSSLGIRRSQELGSGRSTEDVIFLSRRTLEADCGCPRQAVVRWFSSTPFSSQSGLTAPCPKQTVERTKIGHRVHRHSDSGCGIDLKKSAFTTPGAVRNSHSTHVNAHTGVASETWGHINRRVFTIGTQ
jgi:hypothetical protein